MSRSTELSNKQCLHPTAEGGI